MNFPAASHFYDDIHKRILRAKARNIYKNNTLMNADRRLAIARGIALIVVVLISVYIFSIRDQARELAKYGYPGIFLLALLANATVLLPAPGVLFVFTMGTVFNPVGVALAAGAGGTLGELSGYLAGFSGQGVMEKVSIYDRILTWMGKNRLASYLIILVMALIPNPFFDLTGVAAGALRIPVAHFLFFAWIGITLKMLMFAFAGAYLASWIK